MSKSWPSAKALDRSLRMALISKNSDSDADATANTPTVTAAIEEDDNGGKCHLPRPVLNVIMRRSEDQNMPRPTLNMITRPRRDKDQISDHNDNFNINDAAMLKK